MVCGDSTAPIELTGGNCTDDSIGQNFLLTQTDSNGNPNNGNAPFTLDVLPVLVHEDRNGRYVA